MHAARLTNRIKTVPILNVKSNHMRKFVQKHLAKRGVQVCAIGLFSLLLLLILRRDLFWEWDEIVYMIDILAGRRSNLLLGRSGYVFLY